MSKVISGLGNNHALKFWNYKFHNLEGLGGLNRKYNVALEGGSEAVGYNLSPIFFSLYLFTF